MSMPTRGLRLQVKGPRNPRRQAAGQGHMLFFITLCGLLALIVLGKIHLERRTMQTGLKWEQRHRELSNLVKEGENLRLERESHTNRQYILERAENLGLRPPVPGQVRRLAPARPLEPAGPGPAVAASGQ